MVEIPKVEEKKVESAPAVIMSSAAIKPEEIEIEHEDGEGTPSVVRKPKDDPLAELRANQESAERALKEEKERRITAERERDASKAQVETVKTNLAKSETDKVAAQEAAILNRVESAKAELVNAKNAWIEAVDTGKSASVQADLQEKIADATYKLNGAVGAKTHFDNWKEGQKNKPVPKAADDNVSPAAKAWIDSHPRFKTDTKYRRAAERAHEDALDDGVSADSDEYFKRINAAIAPFEGGEPAATPAPARKQASATSTAAPPSNDSAAAGASGGNAASERREGRKTFKLDGAMREMAIKTYGKNSSFKLSDDEAYKKYAARQLEIREKRANGERI